MLTNKQVTHLHEERDHIIAFTQELREMGGTEEDGYFFFLCNVAANAFMAGCNGIDKIILEGSAKDD